jgi:hypothetical protein
MLDDLEFYSWTQPPNSGFENWGAGDATLEPDHWSTANKQFRNVIGRGYAYRDSSMFGTHASICLDGISLPTGFYHTPHISLDSNHYFQTQNPAGVPIGFSPDSICFDYSFESTDSLPCIDSAHFSIHFYSGGSLDEQYFLKLPCTGGAIEHVKMPLDLANQPELVNIYFSPLRMNFSNKENYWLCIDNVSFFCGEIGMQDMDQLDRPIFPNPADKFTQLPEWVERYILLDAQGREVLVGGNTRIKTIDLSEGIYFVKAQSADGRSSIFRLVISH